MNIRTLLHQRAVDNAYAARPCTSSPVQGRWWIRTCPRAVRRSSLGAFHELGRVLDGLQDAHVRAAAAKVRLQRGANLHQLKTGLELLHQLPGSMRPMLLHASRLVVPRERKAVIDVAAPLPEYFAEWRNAA